MKSSQDTDKTVHSEDDEKLMQFFHEYMFSPTPYRDWESDDLGNHERLFSDSLTHDGGVRILRNVENLYKAEYRKGSVATYGRKYDFPEMPYQPLDEMLKLLPGLLDKIPVKDSGYPGYSFRKMILEQKTKRCR